tara:strand:- start:644 stop:910 length:267 start_codon:yes stop_codon:yes gene_type:complete
MEKKITYDDTRDIAIRCVDRLIDLNILPEDEHNFEVQDLIQDEINDVLGLDIDNKFEIKINDAIKLAEDNAQADLEAQDYDVFGQNKI